MTETVKNYESGTEVHLSVENGPTCLSLFCHVHEDSELSYKAYPEDGSLLFQVGSSGTDLTLAAGGEALDRFIFALVAARNHLQEEHAKRYNLPNGPIDLYPVDDK